MQHGADIWLFLGGWKNSHLLYRNLYYGNIVIFYETAFFLK